MVENCVVIYKLFKSIVDDENHKLHKLLPMNVPDIYNFRIPKQFYIPKFRTNRFRIYNVKSLK